VRGAPRSSADNDETFFVETPFKLDGIPEVATTPTWTPPGPATVAAVGVVTPVFLDAATVDGLEGKSEAYEGVSG